MTSQRDERVAVIRGIGTCLPPRSVDNTELSRTLDTGDAWIRSRTGIAARRRVAPGTSTGDLAVAAGAAALRSAGMVRPGTVIVATSTPDHRLPSTAPAVATRLGLDGAAAFDLNAVCAGFVYAVSYASAMIRAGAGDILVIGADTYSTIVDPLDRGTAVIFGDGAGAILLTAGRADEPGAVIATHLGSDGAGLPHVLIEAGGSRCPVAPHDTPRAARHLAMNGRHVYLQAVRRMTESSLEVLRRARWKPEELHAVVAHQANERIVDAVAERLELPASLMVKYIRDVGNTAVASIPLALADATKRTAAPPSSPALATAFGGGFSWGSIAFTWPDVHPEEAPPAS
ncbi:beta-ketoacyl-ACP synthase III [Streptomyces sp. SM11]|uniref:beta-ketoacyl-ACP synthase III n=1 Tax=unclassified Streptomyces TaxID=2593676 RepID=UPI000CD4F95E|nr:beta-ketoacyl-ACP synthase III [Streptomyces sp. SM11]